jgi:hypothetical protein
VGGRDGGTVKLADTGAQGSNRDILYLFPAISCAVAFIRCVVAAGDSHGGKSLTLSRFDGELSTYYLSLANARYFVATLVAPGDALCKPLLPELYEPVLTNIGNGLLVLRGFERAGEAATVQEWRCEVGPTSARPADSAADGAADSGDTCPQSQRWRGG